MKRFDDGLNDFLILYEFYTKIVFFHTALETDVPDERIFEEENDNYFMQIVDGNVMLHYEEEKNSVE